MKKVNKSKGFTLVEVLVAMSIISLIALAFFQVLNNTIKANEKTEKNIQMMDIAQSEMENMLADIREGMKSNSDIKVEINKKIVKLDSLFDEKKTIYPDENDSLYKAEEYTYKDGISKYLIDVKIERKKIGKPQDQNQDQVLKNCYLYSINYTVKEKYEIFSNGKIPKREVSLSTSILSLK